MTNFLRKWIWTVVITAIFALAMYHFFTSEEWRKFQWLELWRSLRNTQPGYILAAIVVTMSTYLWRSLRWGYFLTGVKKVPLRIHFFGQVIGFSCIYLVGRVGELVRPAYIAHKGGVPWASVTAVWFLERVYDGAFLFLILLTSSYVFAPSHGGQESSNIFQSLTQSGKVLILMTGMSMVGLVIFRFNAEKILSYMSPPNRASFLSGQTQKGIKNFIRSFAGGLEIMKNWSAFTGSVLCSVLVWMANISVFWLVAQGVRGDVAQVSWLAMGVPMFCAVIGLTVQVPGLGGGFQVAATLGFTEILGIGIIPATTVALLTWLVITVPASLLGIVLMVQEGISVRKLRSWATGSKDFRS